MRWIQGSFAFGSLLTLVACGSDPVAPQPATQPSPAAPPGSPPPAPEPVTPTTGSGGRWFLASNTRDAGGGRPEAHPLIGYRHDGTSWQRVVLTEDAAGSGIVPSFSPSGRLVVYGIASGNESAVIARPVTAQGFGEPVEIARVSLDTSHVTTWYPNERLAVLPGDGAPGIVLAVRPNGAAQYTAIRDLNRVAPDGAYVVADNTTLVELLPEGGRGASRALPTEAGESVYFDSFSSDGRFVALAVRVGESSWSRVVDLRDPALHATDYLRENVTGPGGPRETKLSWAPSGSTMLVAVAAYESSEKGGVWLADATTGAYAELELAHRDASETIHGSNWLGTSTDRFMLYGSEGVRFLQLAPAATTTDLGVDLDGGVAFSSEGFSHDNRYLFASLGGQGTGLLDFRTAPSTFQALDVGPCGTRSAHEARWSEVGHDATLQCDEYRGEGDAHHHVASAVGILTWEGEQPRTQWSELVPNVLPSGSSLFEPASTRWVAPTKAGLVLHATHALDAGELAPDSAGLVVLSWQ